MTVSAQTLAFEYAANGVTTTFPYGFRVLYADQVKVYVNGTLQVGGYTLIGVGDAGGGNVIFSVAPVNGSTVLVRRISDRVRSTDFQQAPYFTQEELLDIDQDYQTMLLQEASADAINALRIPAVETNLVELPDAATRANKFLVFNGNGDVGLSEGSGNNPTTYYAATKSAGDTLASSLPDGATVIVTADESQGGVRVRYTVASAALTSPVKDDAENVGYLPVGGVSTSLQSKLSESKSVYDFMTAAEIADVKSASPVLDHAVPLQAFFTYVCNNDVGHAECFGNFRTSATITINGIATRYFSMDATIQAIAALDSVVTVGTFNKVKVQGTLEVFGTGSTTFATRTCKVGVKFNGVSGRASFEQIKARYFTESGVTIISGSGGANHNLLDLGNVETYDCGPIDNQHPANWSSRTDSGSSGSIAQRSSLVVDSLPPTAHEDMCIVVIAGKCYIVTSVNTGTNTIQVFPWVSPLADTTGTLYYLYGGGVHIRGNDSGIIGANSIDAIRCSFALWSGALYGAQVKRLLAQSCGAGVALGFSSASAHLSTDIVGAYFEGNAFDVIRVTRSNVDSAIVGTYAMSLAKFDETHQARLTSGELNFSNAYKTLSIIGRKIYSAANKLPKNGRDAVSTFAPEIGEMAIYNRNSATVNLPVLDTSENLTYPVDTIALTYIGTGTNGRPTGSFTFNPPVGWTVNGAASVVFSNFYGPVRFVCEYLTATSNVLVYQTGEPVLTGSKTHDWPDLATATTQSTTVTVTGAALGDFVEPPSMSVVLSGTRLWGEVTATDTVTVYQRNDTGANVNVASGTLRVRVRKA